MATTYKNQVNQYRRMKIETASPEMLILMLYDGAVKNISIAQGALTQEPVQLELASNMLIKAQNIITELMVSLNFEIGGDIARNLFNIYEFVNYTLAQSNINKNADNLDTIISMLKDLRETWQEVIRINKEKYPNGIPAPETSSSEATPENSLATNQEPTAPLAPPTPSPQPVATDKFKQIYGRNIPKKV